MPPFKVSQPFSGVYHIEFFERPGILGEVDMAFHFLRFQEHYESPRFKGTVFTWADYVTWYKTVRGEFSYPWDWGGFNFPGAALTPFRRGDFGPLTKREKVVLAALVDVGPRDYVIGTMENDPEALGHELAHAFWHLDFEYRQAVTGILAGGDYRRQHARLAEGEGYDPSVFTDELQACAVDGDQGTAPDSGRCEQILARFMQVQARRSLKVLA